MQMTRKKRGSADKALFVGLKPVLSHKLKSEFEKNHFIVYQEPHPHKALQIAQKDEISVVLYHQGLSAIKSLEFVRQCAQLISHPAIIVLTQKKSVRNVRSLFQEGAHDCLIQPVQTSHLLHAVQRGLEKRKARIYGVKDPLTGLYNRYAFKNILRVEIQRAQRYDRHLSLLMIDIDHFKKINDLFGHLTGDQILVEFSKILKASFRQTDIITRFGGEEFAIVLPETTIGQATLLAERIRKRIETHDYSRLIDTQPLTVSIGISNYHTPGKKNEVTLLHSADQALYAAKKEGRNKVCISVPLKSRRLTT